MSNTELRHVVERMFQDLTRQYPPEDVLRMVAAVYLERCITPCAERGGSLTETCPLPRKA